MPHTNRKKTKKNGTAGNGDVSAGGAEISKKFVQPTKRKQVEDAEGWTHVVGGGKKVGGGEAWTHAGDFVKDGVAYVERTVEEMRGDLEFYARQWESSEAAKELRGILRGRCKVKSVVCLGLGSLQSARREGRRSSFTQLAALMMILEEFGGIGADKIPCIFQDPQYTETDKEFLTCLAGMVSTKTIGEGPRPAALIGTDVNNFGRFNLTEETETLAQHLDDMVKDCEIINFPQLRHDFSDTKIYWRSKSSV
ncbi:hypothetical protein EYC84_003191 [Monilinia fructicola]|uniref:SRR1-like domain-containing protein n=1 Tax=Monilinia fructicola TaxID=38448 RepID=A0A5M9JWT9_MONFR|nr:hypothetical protein EYC84_003191 [Monilinia fructicola]